MFHVAVSSNPPFFSAIPRSARHRRPSSDRWPASASGRWQVRCTSTQQAIFVGAVPCRVIVVMHNVNVGSNHKKEKGQCGFAVCSVCWWWRPFRQLRTRSTAISYTLGSCFSCYIVSSFHLFRTDLVARVTFGSIFWLSNNPTSYSSLLRDTKSKLDSTATGLLDWANSRKKGTHNHKMGFRLIL